jgi:carbon storage regulator
MLVLSRRIDERIMIGDQIEISIVDIKGDQVKIGIQAPGSIKVYRKEVYEAIQQENIEAARARPAALPDLDRLLDGEKKSNRKGGGQADKG